MYKAHREEYKKDMGRKWEEGAAERKKSYEEMKKKSKIFIPQVFYMPRMKIGMIVIMNIIIFISLLLLT
jgi:hypothetical protein